MTVKDLKVITAKHSAMVAQAAYAIALRTNGLIDPTKAHMAGALHDIGKLYLPDYSQKYMHPIIGYEKMMENHDPEMAEICISHPFPVFDFREYVENYCKGDQAAVEKIMSLLKSIKLTPLIRLIQFADKISGLDYYMRFEDKLKWYVEKYNVDAKTIEQNLRGFSEIKRDLDTMTGIDVYTLIDCAAPNV